MRELHFLLSARCRAARQVSLFHGPQNRNHPLKKLAEKPISTKVNLLIWLIRRFYQKRDLPAGKGQMGFTDSDSSLSTTFSPASFLSSISVTSVTARHKSSL